MNPANGEIDRRENTAGAGGRSFPRAAALHGVGVDSPATLLGQHSHSAYVRRIVCELQLLDCRVAPFDVLNAMKQFRIFAQGTRDSAQSTDMLRMSPAGVVTAAVAV
jgi:hypothetical protein